MKFNVLFAISIAFSVTSYGQNVGIGTSTPNALLDVTSTSDGVLIPRVALTGTGSASPLTSPAVSTLVYNTATAGSGATAVAPGFYYWNGSAWVAFIDNSSLTGSTTVSNTSSANTLSTTVNGVTGSTVPLINTNVVSQNGSGQLISTINGVGSTPYTAVISGDVTGDLGASTVRKIQGTPVTVSSLADGNLMQYNASGTDWVNVTPAAILGATTTNTLALSTNTLTSTVNGVPATSSAVSGVSNTSSVNTLSTTVNGVTGSTVPIVNSISNASSVNTLTTTVNGQASSGASIINSNALGLSGTSLTATINGVASNALDISSVDKNIYNSDGTLTGARTVSLAGNSLNFTGGNVGVGIASPQTNLDVLGVEFIRDNATLSSVGSAFKIIASAGTNYIESAGAGMGSGTAADLLFTGMNGSPLLMTIKSTGSVGIGIAIPGYTLDLNQGTFGFGANDVRTEVLLDAGLQGNAGAQSGFFQNDGSTVTDYPAGSSGWMHIIDCRHSNSTNNYAMQFTGSFFDQNLYFRKTNNSASQPWSRVMTSTDVNGTTNYVSKFTSANTIGNSLIYDNGTSVGIGTTGPTSPLEVDQAYSGLVPTLLLKQPIATWGTTAFFASYRFIQTTSAATDGNFRAFNVGAGGVAIGYTATPVYGSGDALYVNGNVGIGTSGPSAQLHTTGTVRFANYPNGVLSTDGSGNLQTTAASSFITTSNIASQSVSYATSCGCRGSAVLSFSNTQTATLTHNCNNATNNIILFNGDAGNSPTVFVQGVSGVSANSCTVHLSANWNGLYRVDYIIDP